MYMMLRGNNQNKGNNTYLRDEVSLHNQHYFECLEHLEDLALLVLCFMHFWKILNFWRFWYLTLQILEFLKILMLAFTDCVNSSTVSSSSIGV